MIGFALMLMAADPMIDATEAIVASKRKGALSVLIHSETFKRPLADSPDQAFRVDYKASVKWILSQDKDCSLIACRTRCTVTFTSKILSRKIWWLPADRPPVLAEDAPAEREYPGGVVHYGRPCKALSDEDANRAASERLRPFQFTDEMIKDRPMRDKAGDNFLALYPPIAPPQ